METSSSDRYTSTDLEVESPGPFPRGKVLKRELPNTQEFTSISQQEKYDASRKRKRATSVSSEKSVSKFQVSYRGGYHELFNEVVEEAASRQLSDGSSPLQASWIGITHWSPEEKGLLFDSLARNGRDDIKAIAGAIGTKSEPEVQTYMQLLRDGLLGRAIVNDPQILVKDAEIPFALEIGPECDIQLEMAAAALATKQSVHEMSIEKKRHGIYWLLDHQTSDLIEERRTALDAISPGEEIGQDLKAACEILNLKNMLMLSSQVFMNSTNPESNWWTYSRPGELPSICSTAFIDLYNLILGITKRLISSAIFFAMSRIRVRDRKHGKRGQYVRGEDVHAALDVTGMKSDPRGYWINLPRRCNLEVYDVPGRKRKFIKGRKLSYEEVEEKLREPYVRDISRSTSLEAASGDQHSSDSSDDYSDSDVDSNEQAPASPSSQEAPNDVLEDDDASLDATDIRASQYEERRLWDILEQDPLEGAWSKKRVSRIQGHASTSVEEDVSADWRNWINYRSEWETYTSPIGEEAFANNQRLRTGQRDEASQSSDEGEDSGSNEEIEDEGANSS